MLFIQWLEAVAGPIVTLLPTTQLAAVVALVAAVAAAALVATVSAVWPVAAVITAVRPSCRNKELSLFPRYCNGQQICVVGSIC
jgi:hypothetical protein